jgi:hypothetical protein
LVNQRIGQVFNSSRRNAKIIGVVGHPPGVASYGNAPGLGSYNRWRRAQRNYQQQVISYAHPKKTVTA